MNVIMWFLIGRWMFKSWNNELKTSRPGRDLHFLSACHNNNLYGCRKHPVIYNDMCRIVRGVKG